MQGAEDADSVIGLLRMQYERYTKTSPSTV